LEAIPDLLVFDWVLSLGSTKDAAEVLGIPQSSVSRR
jgi:DNA-binding transcriptional LysR family regulator